MFHSHTKIDTTKSEEKLKVAIAAITQICRQSKDGVIQIKEENNETYSKEALKQAILSSKAMGNFILEDTSLIIPVSSFEENLKQIKLSLVLDADVIKRLDEAKKELINKKNELQKALHEKGQKWVNAQLKSFANKINEQQNKLINTLVDTKGFLITLETEKKQKETYIVSPKSLAAQKIDAPLQELIDNIPSTELVERITKKAARGKKKILDSTFWDSGWEKNSTHNIYYTKINDPLIKKTFETEFLNKIPDEPNLSRSKTGYVVCDVGGGTGRLGLHLISAALDKGINLNYILIEPSREEYVTAVQNIKDFFSENGSEENIENIYVHLFHGTLQEFYEKNINYYGQVNCVISSGGPLNEQIVTMPMAKENLTFMTNLLAPQGTLIASGLSLLLLKNRDFAEAGLTVLKTAEKIKPSDLSSMSLEQQYLKFRPCYVSRKPPFAIEKILWNTEPQGTMQIISSQNEQLREMEQPREKQMNRQEENKFPFWNVSTIAASRDASEFSEALEYAKESKRKLGDTITNFIEQAENDLSKDYKITALTQVEEAYIITAKNNVSMHELKCRIPKKEIDEINSAYLESLPKKKNIV